MKRTGLISKIRLLQVSLVSVAIAALMAFAPSQQNAEEEWTLLASENGVKAYAMDSKCDKGDVYLFKFENTTNSTIRVNYTLRASQDPTIPPISKQIELSANQITSGDCDSMWETAMPNTQASKGDLNRNLEVSLTINQ